MRKLKIEMDKKLLALTYQERRKKAIKDLKNEMDFFEQMDNYEIDYEYIITKTEYEHKKRTLSILLVSILLSFLMGIWKYCFEFIERVLRISASFHGEEIIVVKTAVVIFGIIVFFFSVLILGVFLTHIKSIDRTYQRLLMIEACNKSSNRSI